MVMSEPPLVRQTRSDGGSCVMTGLSAVPVAVWTVPADVDGCVAAVAEAVSTFTSVTVTPVVLAGAWSICALFSGIRSEGEKQPAAVKTNR